MKTRKIVDTAIGLAGLTAFAGTMLFVVLPLTALHLIIIRR
jgi:hypothetical protein